MIGSYEAEAAVLGALLNLTSPLAQHGFLRQLEQEDFVDPRNQVVLQAMRALMQARHPIDPVTVLGELRRSGGERSMTADKSAGVYVADLFQASPVVASLSHYLLILLEHRVRRVAEDLGVRLQQVATTSSQNEVTSLLRESFAGVADQLLRLETREKAEHEQVSA